MSAGQTKSLTTRSMASATATWNACARSADDTPCRTPSTRSARTGPGASTPLRHPNVSTAAPGRPVSASASNSIAAWASKSTRWRTPSNDAAASNNRPTLVVDTQPISRSTCRTTTSSSTESQAAAAGSSGSSSDAERGQVRDRDPTRRSDPGVAARQRELVEMGDPPEARIVGEQELTTPDLHLTIGDPVPGSVEGHAEDRFGPVESVFGHQRGDVGVVMLDIDRSMGVPIQRPLPRGVSGMTVDPDHAPGRRRTSGGNRRRSQRRPRVSRCGPCRRRAGRPRRAGRRRHSTCSSAHHPPRRRERPRRSAGSGAVHIHAIGGSGARHQRRPEPPNRRRAARSVGRGRRTNPPVRRAVCVHRHLRSRSVRRSGCPR